MRRESFFANCRIRGGYSGVATFCRAGTCMPVAALDGFSGVLPQTLAKPKDLPPSTTAQEALSNPCSDLFERYVLALHLCTLLMLKWVE